MKQFANHEDFYHVCGKWSLLELTIRPEMPPWNHWFDIEDANMLSACGECFDGTYEPIVPCSWPPHY